mgnify:CR=1 FL=1
MCHDDVIFRLIIVFVGGMNAACLVYIVIRIIGAILLGNVSNKDGLLGMWDDMRYLYGYIKQLLFFGFLFGLLFVVIVALCRELAIIERFIKWILINVRGILLLILIYLIRGNIIRLFGGKRKGDV